MLMELLDVVTWKGCQCVVKRLAGVVSREIIMMLPSHSEVFKYLESL